MTRSIASDGLRRHGVTTVEVAIILAVIGLLLAGVLGGQDLLFNARVKGTYQMARALASAIDSYRTRYGQLPGDDKAAASRFAATNPPTHDGDGNGALAFGDCSGGQSAAENCEALYQLRLAGLINGADRQPLHTPLGGPAFPASARDVVPAMGAGIVLAFPPLTLTHRAAAALDRLHDDGAPATGSFRCAGLTEYDLAEPDSLVPSYCALAL